jgi:hypothetical protein
LARQHRPPPRAQRHTPRTTRHQRRSSERPRDATAVRVDEVSGWGSTASRS